MGMQDILQYRIVVAKDPETGCVVAEVPALGIADQGIDVPEALANMKAMVTFHVECLQEEGEPIPSGEVGEEGLYVHVRLPAQAA
jgi:predicted RNase H-like HicB family nuclease